MGRQTCWHRAVKPMHHSSLCLMHTQNPQQHTCTRENGLETLMVCMAGRLLALMARSVALWHTGE